MDKIVNGQQIASQIFERVTHKVADLAQQNIYPELGVILVGNDDPSEIYVAKKEEACLDTSIAFELHEFSSDISQQDLEKKIIEIQQDKNLTGLIIQLPLPSKFNKHEIVNKIQPEKDVDFMTDVNLGRLISGNYDIMPPTPGAILEILESYQIDLVGKNVVVIGAGDLVGRPLVNILMHKKAAVTVVNDKIDEVENFTKAADIVITAAGQPNLLTAEMIKEGAIIIDAGTTAIDGRLSGDVDIDSVAKKASLITPTPGGVGPITVAKLVENLVDFAKLNN